MSRDGLGWRGPEKQSGEQCCSSPRSASHRAQGLCITEKHLAEMAVFPEPSPRCTEGAGSVGLKQLQGDCLVGFGILGYFRDGETFFSPSDLLSVLVALGKPRPQHILILHPHKIQ